MLIDCGPSRFAIWKRLHHQNSADIIKQLEVVFCEREPPIELFTDNGAAFYRQRFAEFAWTWSVHVQFWCAHIPSGNRIVERSHRTIKRIAVRMQCSITEVVYWYNVMPKDDKTDSTAPANTTYSYKIHIKGIDVVLVPDNAVSCPYIEGDAVWVKNLYGRCTKMHDTIWQGHSNESQQPTLSFLMEYRAT